MDLSSTIAKLESTRIKCEDYDPADYYILSLEVINILLDYIDNKQLRDKVDEVIL